jgi:enamine deaminase RidA (YjgF/YER057c/UK114 family)
MAKRNVSGGVIHGNTLYLSGMCCVADTLEAEIRQNMDELGKRMTAVGATWPDVLSATVYLRDLNDRERTLNAIWKEYFPENAPARTCVEAGIGKCRCEITLIVAVPN